MQYVEYITVVKIHTLYFYRSLKIRLHKLLYGLMLAVNDFTQNAGEKVDCGIRIYLNLVLHLIFYIIYVYSSLDVSDVAEL